VCRVCGASLRSVGTSRVCLVEVPEPESVVLRSVTIQAVALQIALMHVLRGFMHLGVNGTFLSV
jgi:hypothetical protein